MRVVNVLKAYMGLTCRIGNYNAVIEELLKMDISVGNIFMLYGPIDILCLFTGFESIEEFKRRWFTPISRIGGDEPLIKSTTSFIVHESPKSFFSEPYAFLFLKRQPRNLKIVQEALLKIPEVLAADSVFGPYDVIVPVQAKDREDLERVVSNIHKHVPAIEGSMTTIIAMMRV